VKDIAALRGTSNRVLFQNVEGNINMGVWFNDPDVEMEDICWYNLLAKTIYNTKVENPELISVDYKLGAISCYVELHRNGNDALQSCKLFPILYIIKYSKTIPLIVTLLV